VDHQAAAEGFLQGLGAPRMVEVTVGEEDGFHGGKGNAAVLDIGEDPLPGVPAARIDESGMPVEVEEINRGVLGGTEPVSANLKDFIRNFHGDPRKPLRNPAKS